MTIEEAAALAGVSCAEIRRWISWGWLPTYPCGRLSASAVLAAKNRRS